MTTACPTPPYPAPTDPDGQPDVDEIRDWIFDRESPRATDGCTVEPDGWCPHGHVSWMIYLNLV